MATITIKGKEIELTEKVVSGYNIFRVKVEGFNIQIDYAKDWQKGMDGYCIFIYKQGTLVASSLHDCTKRYLTFSDVSAYIESVIKVKS